MGVDKNGANAERSKLVCQGVHGWRRQPAVGSGKTAKLHDGIVFLSKNLPQRGLAFVQLPERKIGRGRSDFWADVEIQPGLEFFWHETPPPPLVPRVTLTLPVLNAARQVIFLVSGAGKAERLAEVLRVPPSPPLLPAQLIQPDTGELLWLIDKPAAALL